MAIRLINTTTLELKLFVVNPPRYAILSHLWGDDEITFDDVEKAKNIKSLCHKAAFAKITGFCMAASREDYHYVWVDTCCIDKRSSSELQAAINSMMAWYRNAAKCFVYLSDVEATGTDAKGFETELRKSRWFTRGWTLQELLAPQYLTFHNARWEFLSTGMGLSRLVSSITGIAGNVLCGKMHYLNTSVAQRMSWAASRKTSVSEDIAYCLLGLFDVHMPLLYGEGQVSAFKRLQKEILAESEDESIFAWFGPGCGSMIASAPACFATSGRIKHAPRNRCFDPERPPYSMTNKGLQFKPRMLDPRTQYKLFRPLKKESGTGKRPSDAGRTVLVPLNCIQETRIGQEKREVREETVAVQLVEVAGSQEYRRLSGNLFVSTAAFNDQIDNVALVESHRRYRQGSHVANSPKEPLVSDGKSEVCPPSSQGSASFGLETEYMQRKVMFIKERPVESIRPSAFFWYTKPLSRETSYFLILTKVQQGNIFNIGISVYI